MRITVVEDNKTLALAIAHLLRDQGHGVDVINDGDEAAVFVVQERPDVIVLDINLPGCSGLEILRKMRTNGLSTPVILLTARGETKDRVEGLNLGADDYLVKPFEMEELDARIRAISRRNTQNPVVEISNATVYFDQTSRQIFVNGKPLNLPRREVATFECLSRNAGKLVSKPVLADHLYGVGADVEEKIVEVYISRLRKRLSSYGVEIKAARGLGYMMTLPK